MFRCSFDIVDAGVPTRDEFGEVLADDGEARDRTIPLPPDAARDVLPNGDPHDFVARVRHENGEIVREAPPPLDGRWRPDQGR